jgi:hypothetical protein
MREFQLIVSAARGDAADVPRRLLEMADLFVTRYGAQIDKITKDRMAA